MNATGLLKTAYLTLLSRPKHDRIVYRAVRRLQAASIVEIGVQQGLRSRRMIETALRCQHASRVRYTGIDLFEARPATHPGIRLKEAHRLLAATGVTGKLIPGDPFSALARSANALTGTDLVVISADQDQEALARAWYYVPRMLHARSLVYVETGRPSGDASGFRTLDVADVAELARRTSAKPRRAA